MVARILHVSDLHVGAHGDDLGLVATALRSLVVERSPELVVASGDLTHRNRAEQHSRAGGLLRALGPPVLAVAGNHDLPALPARRLTAPFVSFLREWRELEPVYRSHTIVVCGLNSVRPLRYQRGALSAGQLARAATIVSSAPQGALRVVAVHHHLAGAPWRTGKRSLPRRAHVLSTLGAAGVELVLSGHTHQALVLDRREILAGEGALVLATAPGLGRPRLRRHAEAVGLHLIEAEPHRLRIETYAVSGGRLALVAERAFTRPS